MSKEIYKNYSQIFIKFCKGVSSDNFELSKLFGGAVENMKNSFLNLSAIKDEKNKDFEQDIIIQNNYLELLNELFDDNSHNLQIFNFNGTDSGMSYKIKESNLSNKIIIFSFKFKNQDNINDEKKIYTLVTFYNESKNKNVMILFIEFKKSKN